MSTTLQASAESVDVRNLSCSTCLQQGYRCPAHAMDTERGPVCIYHEDDDACPHKNAPRVAIPSEMQPAKHEARTCQHPGCYTVLSSANKTEYCSLHRGLHASKPETVQTRKEHMPLEDAPLCKAPGCETQTKSKVGYCAKHFWLSRVKHQGERPTCSVCGVLLRRDNELRLCKKHRSGSHPNKAAKQVRANAARLSRPSVASCESMPPSPRATLSLTESQIVAFFSHLPLEEKAALLNSHFEKEVL